jgi:hypothetical protein
MMHPGVRVRRVQIAEKGQPQAQSVRIEPRRREEIEVFGHAVAKVKGEAGAAVEHEVRRSASDSGHNRRCDTGRISRHGSNVAGISGTTIRLFAKRRITGGFALLLTIAGQISQAVVFHFTTPNGLTQD